MKKLYILFIALTLLGSLSCGSFVDALLYDVSYSVTCSSGTVNVTIQNSSKGTSQFSDVKTPWNYDFSAEDNDFVYVSAQNNQSSGKVSCYITKDGNTIKSNSCSGAYCIATCSGSL